MSYQGLRLIYVKFINKNEENWSYLAEGETEEDLFVSVVNRHWM